MQIRQLRIICPMVVGLMMATGCATEKPQDGMNAEACTAIAAADGSIILNCPDSEPITIRNGMDGATGTPGTPGNSGDDADPCTVTDNNDGTISIDCPDGTSVTYNVPLCGNGELEAGEECDDANDDNSDECLSTCMEATCGDNFVGPNEYCDGNLLEDFQCDATCGGFMCAADFEITTDDQIITLDGCSQVVGSLSITGTTLTNLAGLERLQKITSNLVIKNNTMLEDFDALTNLVAVDNELEIENNAALENLTGLNNVREVDYLTVKNNPSLPTCEAEALQDLLGGVDALQGIVIYGNDDLATCD